MLNGALGPGNVRGGRARPWRGGHVCNMLQVALLSGPRAGYADGGRRRVSGVTNSRRRHSENAGISLGRAGHLPPGRRRGWWGRGTDIGATPDSRLRARARAGIGSYSRSTATCRRADEASDLLREASAASRSPTGRRGLDLRCNRSNCLVLVLLSPPHSLSTVAQWDVHHGGERHPLGPVDPWFHCLPARVSACELLHPFRRPLGFLEPPRNSREVAKGPFARRGSRFVERGTGSRRR